METPVVRTHQCWSGARATGVGLIAAWSCKNQDFPAQLFGAVSMGWFWGQTTASSIIPCHLMPVFDAFFLKKGAEQ